MLYNFREGRLKWSLEKKGSLERKKDALYRGERCSIEEKRGSLERKMFMCSVHAAYNKVTQIPDKKVGSKTSRLIKSYQKFYYYLQSNKFIPKFLLLTSLYIYFNHLKSGKRHYSISLQVQSKTFIHITFIQVLCEDY